MEELDSQNMKRYIAVQQFKWKPKIKHSSKLDKLMHKSKQFIAATTADQVGLGILHKM